MSYSQQQTLVRRRVSYVVSNELIKASSLLPSNKTRSWLVHSLIKECGLLTADHDFIAEDEAQLIAVRSRQATMNELCSYHDRAYIEFILTHEKHHPDALSSVFGLEDDCPPFAGMGSYVFTVAGATLTAVECLASGSADVAIAWDGGRYDDPASDETTDARTTRVQLFDELSQKSKAAGFCYVADCILALLYLRRAKPISLGNDSESGRKKAKVMYLDFDLHFSDGASECFYRSAPEGSFAQVLTLSIHHTAPGFYPVHELSALPDPESDTFDPFTLSIPLKQGASSETFSHIWESVEEVRKAFSPDYVVVQCGADGLAGDPHAVWNWSVGEGRRGDMDWCVEQIITKWKVRILLLGGGGYNHPNTARAWAHLTAVARGTPLPADAHVPEHSAFSLYAPSFTMEVPAGNMRDENTVDHLERIRAVYATVAAALTARNTEA